MKEKWWWLAINGSSCAASALPLSEKLQVVPTPEILVGYTTQEEQLERQKFFLEAPVEDVRRYANGELPALAAAYQAIVRRLPDPMPQTSGATVWLDE